jgi:hypothetical protein
MGADDRRVRHIGTSASASTSTSTSTSTSIVPPAESHRSGAR